MIWLFTTNDIKSLTTNALMVVVVVVVVVVFTKPVTCSKGLKVSFAVKGHFLSFPLQQLLWSITTCSSRMFIDNCYHIVLEPHKLEAFLKYGEHNY